MGTICPHVHRVSCYIAWAVEQGGERRCFLPFWKFSQRKADPDPASCMRSLFFSTFKFPLDSHPFGSPKLFWLPLFLRLHFTFWTPTLFGLQSSSGFSLLSSLPPLSRLCAVSWLSRRRRRSKLVATRQCLARQNCFLSFPVTLGVGACSSRVVVVPMGLEAVGCLCAFR